MKSIVNPISYDDLEPEVQLGLARYLAKLECATACHWKITHVYKPTRWYKARLTSEAGAELIVWYRSKQSYWTPINGHFGRGIGRNHRLTRLMGTETRTMLLAAIRRVAEIPDSQFRRPQKLDAETIVLIRAASQQIRKRSDDHNFGTELSIKKCHEENFKDAY